MSTTDLLPGVFAGILAIYGLVAAVLISGHIKVELSLFTALVNLGSGVAVGLCGLVSTLIAGRNILRRNATPCSVEPVLT